MIRSLRRAHGAWWLGLALLLPAGLLLALWSRPPAVLPVPANPAGWGESIGARISLAPTALVLSPADGGRLLVGASGPAGDLAPGLFLYSTEDAVAVGGPLPADAQRLGRAIPGRTVVSPPSAAKVVLYSALSGTVVAVGEPGEGGAP